MSERIKLGLTRNRLFEFDNCVSFVGTVDKDFDISEVEKALKMLFLKEPILSANVELSENGQAFLVTEKVEPDLEVVTGDIGSLVEKKTKDGFDFTEKLFSFAVVENKTLCIFAHTLVADVRSLMMLAVEFMEFYNKETLSIEPSKITVFSETSQMPSNVFSIVIDRLASDLEVGWQKKTATFSVGDYKKAREKYFSTKSGTNSVCLNVKGETLKDIKKFSQNSSVDVSSVVAFAFYESLMKHLQGKRKYRKLNVQANERVFFENFSELGVGAFNGLITVAAKKEKNAPVTIEDKAVGFHKEIYKRVTSSFSVFYNEFLSMRLPPSFCDSQYMYCAGEFEHKYSKKLALTYGCANEVAGEFCSYNLTQKYWEKLSCFNDISVSEPLKMRSSCLVTFTENVFGGKVIFQYKTEKISDSVAQSVIKTALEFLEIFQ